MELLETVIGTFADLPADVRVAGSNYIAREYSESRLREQGANYVSKMLPFQRDWERERWVDACANPTHRTARLVMMLVSSETPQSREEACAVMVAIGSVGLDEVQRSKLPSPLREAPIDRGSNYFLNGMESRLAASLRRAERLLADAADREASRAVRVQIGVREVEITGFVAGEGETKAVIRGPALVPFFNVVRDLSAARSDGSCVPWKDVERAWHLSTGFKGHILPIASLQRYGRRIRGILRDRGLGHLWMQDAGSGLRWKG